MQEEGLNISNFDIYALAIIRTGGKTQELLRNKGVEITTITRRENKIVLQDITEGMFKGLLGLVHCQIDPVEGNMAPSKQPLNKLQEYIQDRLGIKAVNLEFRGFVYEMAFGDNRENQYSRYLVYVNTLKRSSIHYSGKDFQIIDMCAIPIHEILAPKQRIHPTHRKILETLSSYSLETNVVSLNWRVEVKESKGKFIITNVK